MPIIVMKWPAALAAEARMTCAKWSSMEISSGAVRVFNPTDARNRDCWTYCRSTVGRESFPQNRVRALLSDHTHLLNIA